MRPGRLTPENLVKVSGNQHRRLRASMRPGRLTPENRQQEHYRSLSIASFNEAGAINPGKPRYVGKYLNKTRELQ